MAPPWRGAVPHCERLRLGIGGRDATAGRARNVPDEGAAATDPDPSSAQHAKPKASMPPLVASVPLARGSNPWTRALRCDFARLEGKSGIPAARVLLPLDSPLLVPITERSLHSAHEVGLEITHPSAAAYTFGCGRPFGASAADQHQDRGARLQPPSVEALHDAFGSAAGAISAARTSAWHGGPSPKLFHNLHGTFGAPPPARDLVGRLSDGSYYASVPSRHEPPLDLDVLVSPRAPPMARRASPRAARVSVRAAPPGSGVATETLRLRSTLAPAPPVLAAPAPMLAADHAHAASPSMARSGGAMGGARSTTAEEAESTSRPNQPTTPLFGTDTRSLPNPYANLWMDAA